MEPRRLRHLERVDALGRQVPVAKGLSRLLGLALLDRDRAGSGLLIPRCGSVHTFGMRFPLDIVFFDRDGHRLRELAAVPPLRFVACAGAAAVLELPTPGVCGSAHRGTVCGSPEKENEMSIFDKLTGRAKKAAGDLTGDSSMRREGSREERKGEAKEDLNRAQDKAADKAEEVSDLERKT